MLAKQISVFVENTKGRLAEITRILADNHVNIRALSIADTTSFGILRVIVEDTELTAKVLKEAGLTVSVTDVLSLQIEDRPGGLAGALQILADCQKKLFKSHGRNVEERNLAYRKRRLRHL